MRDFAKHVIQALAEDEWVFYGSDVRHVKSRLRIDFDEMRVRDTPISFTWWERRCVKHAMRKMIDRVAAERFLIYRVNPKKPAVYGQDDSFL